MVESTERPLVSVIVVNWNGRRYLAECLEALRAQTYDPVEIVVVDNGSTDDSAGFVRERYPEAHLIALPYNTGFAAGHNRGIQAARGVYVATLNNDAVPDPHWLSTMVATAERDPRIGMVAAKLLFYDRPDVVDAAGICVDRVGVAWNRHRGHLDDPTEREVDVFGPCAAAALYRRSMLDEIGLFDESFFCYLEDVDLAWRARLAGWRCRYEPAARVRHRSSATAGEASPFKRFHLARNKVWLIAKNYPTPALYWYLPLIVVYDLLGVLALLLFGHRYGLSRRARLAALVGRFAALPGLPRALAARQRNRGAASRAARVELEPLVAPWEVSRRWPVHLSGAGSII